MVHQLIDVCHINQRHLTGLPEEFTNLLSQITVLMSRMPVGVHTPSVAAPVADSPMAVPPPVPNATVSSDRRRRVCRRPGCDTAVPQDVVCCFARPNVQAPGVESMDKEQGIRIVLVAIRVPQQNVTPPAPVCLVGACVAHCDHWQCSRARMGRGWNSRRSHVLSNTCRDPSCDERVHPECSSRRCTLHHQPILCVPLDPGYF